MPVTRLLLFVEGGTSGGNTPAGPVLQFAFACGRQTKKYPDGTQEPRPGFFYKQDQSVILPS